MEEELIEDEVDQINEIEHEEEKVVEIQEVEIPMEQKEVEHNIFEPVVAEESTMQLVMREESSFHGSQHAKPHPSSLDMPIDDAEEQRKKVAERIQKLRNLSFNINSSSDPNNEFDAVPAYVRRNLDLFGNTMASVENYYSKYTVEKDENNQTQISTINTFLDGKKPD